MEGAQSLLKEAGVPFEREIGSGDPASTLIEIAERHGCEAIILGARGMGARGMGALRSALSALCRRRCCMRPRHPSLSSSMPR